jgi:hypothetical protein
MAQELLAAKFGNLDLLAHGGFGAAVLSSSYRPSISSATEVTNDYVLGPAWSVTLLLGPAFVSFDAILGLRDFIQHIALNFQDVALVSVGVSL